MSKAVCEATLALCTACTDPSGDREPLVMPLPFQMENQKVISGSAGS